MSNLKAIRGELGVTQQALAEKVGVSQSAFNHYENGNRTVDTVLGWRIVNALNLLGADCKFEDVFPDPQEDCETKGHAVKPPTKGANGE
ncbi:helix-turn-helix transcriptional regulator [Vibrio parahaemolyticus]|jgi:putative transcriptional regulator|uniref:helix-turn-helix transcriptional regulator n=1 Tax=Vibrio parahaemolyticus TaxID=670 RepID=UPI00111D6A62|nr:helix-turn-helix transcriptional regulator [Vibrio parahaemolyticus]TOJ99041.1 transcriptional regulator [Vibrio parahaemolyticus]